MQNQWVRGSFPTENRQFLPSIPVHEELRSIAYAIERLGCRMGEDPERAILRKEALADRVRAVAAQIGGAA